ncbi:hypothetical protein [Pseudomonas fluorescens group sp. PF-69]
MDILSALLAAVQLMPNAAHITQHIVRNKTMSISQKIIGALYQITNTERFGFYVAEEPVLIERILEVAELPMTGESAAEVKSHLTGVTPALNRVGIEVTNPRDGYLTVWGPGVKK